MRPTCEARHSSWVTYEMVCLQGRAMRQSLEEETAEAQGTKGLKAQKGSMHKRDQITTGLNAQKGSNHERAQNTKGRKAQKS